MNKYSDKQSSNCYLISAKCIGDHVIIKTPTAIATVKNKQRKNFDIINQVKFNLSLAFLLKCVVNLL